MSDGSAILKDKGDRSEHFFLGMREELGTCFLS